MSSTSLQQSSEIKWIQSVIFDQFLGLDLKIEQPNESTFVIHFEGRTLTLPNVFLKQASNSWLSPSTLPQLPLLQWDVSATELKVNLVSQIIPVLYGNPGFNKDKDGNGFLYLDVIGSAFFMLSRYEEVISQECDLYDRFPGDASIAYKANFLDRPLIDEYVEILWAAIHDLWPSLQRRSRQFKLLASHDVDRPSRFAFCSWLGVLGVMGVEVMKRGNFLLALKGPILRLQSHRKISPKDPYNTFSWIMDQSERYGLQSAFYFICGRTNQKMDADYEIEHPAIQKLLLEIHLRGHEIGLHPSFETYLDPQRLLAEALRLKQICKKLNIVQKYFGGRMHILRWRTPTTMLAWENAEMHYDSTLGHGDMVGFRCGTCHEYSAFDPVEKKELKLRIRPLIVMDRTLLDPMYMNLSHTAALDVARGLKNCCKQFNGNFTLLWHNHAFAEMNQRSLYEAILRD